jgi:hypothetical protein
MRNLGKVFCVFALFVVFTPSFVFSSSVYNVSFEELVSSSDFKRIKNAKTPADIFNFLIERKDNLVAYGLDVQKLFGDVVSLNIACNRIWKLDRSKMILSLSGRGYFNLSVQDVIKGFLFVACVGNDYLPTNEYILPDAVRFKSIPHYGYENTIAYIWGDTEESKNAFIKKIVAVSGKSEDEIRESIKNFEKWNEEAKKRVDDINAKLKNAGLGRFAAQILPDASIKTGEQAVQKAYKLKKEEPLKIHEIQMKKREEDIKRAEEKNKEIMKIIQRQK